MTLGQGRFLNAIADYEQSLREDDGPGLERAHSELQRLFEGATLDELSQGAPRLAAILDDVPYGAAANLAVVIGACVERGTDPAECAMPVLTRLFVALGFAQEFAEKWTAAGGGDLPAPVTEGLDEAVERLGALLAMAWWTLDDWVRAGVAMLQHRPVRQQLFESALYADLMERCLDLAEIADRYYQDLLYVLTILDDEQLVVLHRETGTGYLLRMTGIGDNFQLHTLLADALIGGGHLPGEPPSPDAVAVSRDAKGQVLTTGSFNLVAPDGTWIWNEGTPSDIPEVDDIRLLVLDPPPYLRNWPAGRYFPHMPGELTLERVLSAEETTAWFAHVEPAKEPVAD